VLRLSARSQEAMRAELHSAYAQLRAASAERNAARAEASAATAHVAALQADLRAADHMDKVRPGRHCYIIEPAALLRVVQQEVVKILSQALCCAELGPGLVQASKSAARR